MIIRKAGVSELQNGTAIDGIQTITGLRISAVDGTAFLDNCAELQKYTNRMIRIYDSGSRYLEGWIKANGSGETLGNELYEYNNNCLSDDQTEGNALSGITANGTPTIFESTSDGAPYAGNYHLHIATDGLYDGATIRVLTNWQNEKLLQYSIYYKRVSGADITLSVSSNSILNSLSQNVSYHTGNGGMSYMYVRALTSPYISEFYIDNLMVKYVLTPSALGLTIVSTQGGSTYNFTTKTASFVYNAASYRYKIF